MAQDRSFADMHKSAGSMGSQEFPMQFAEMGKRQFEAFAETQRQIWETAGKVSQAWVDQSQTEVALVSELFNKLASARSIPDATSIYQEFMNRQMQMLTDNSRRMFDDSENLMSANARFFSKGGGMSS